MQILDHKKGNQMISPFIKVSILIFNLFFELKPGLQINLFILTSQRNKYDYFFNSNVSFKMQFFGKNSDTEY